MLNTRIGILWSLASVKAARDHNIPIRVFNMNKAGALKSVIMGHSEGTVISHK
jgi:uridylate kinase